MLLAGSCLVLQTIQLGLLVSEPKLCSLCLIAGAVFICAATQCIYVLGTGQLRRFVPPKAFSHLFLVILGLGITYQTLLASGVSVATSVSKEDRAVAAALGTDIRGFIPEFQSDGASVLLVTQPGCHACENARVSLNAASIRFAEYRGCTYLVKQGCFDAKEKVFATPLVLILDKDRRIVFLHEGWPDGQGAEDLVRILKESAKEKK